MSEGPSSPSLRRFAFSLSRTLADACAISWCTPLMTLLMSASSWVGVMQGSRVSSAPRLSLGRLLASFGRGADLARDRLGRFVARGGLWPDASMVV